MKGDIAFVGFMLTADEWQELDAQSRAQLIAVATRRADPRFERSRRLAEGTGPHEVIEVEVLDADLLEDDEDLAAGVEQELEMLAVEDLEDEQPTGFAPESLLASTDDATRGQPWFGGDGAVPLIAADIDDDELFAGVDKMLDDEPSIVDATLDATDKPALATDDEISFADLFDD